jgi:hypothetical protein
MARRESLRQIAISKAVSDQDVGSPLTISIMFVAFQRTDSEKLLMRTLVAPRLWLRAP